MANSHVINARLAIYCPAVCSSVWPDVDKAAGGRHRQRMHRHTALRPCDAFKPWMLLCLWILSGCAGERRSSPLEPAPGIARQIIERSLPHGLADARGWTDDLVAGFSALGIEITAAHACAVAAVIAQESGFRVDPIIPGLPAIAWNEIDKRAAHAGVPKLVLHSILSLPSAGGLSYSERIERAKTEHELSDIFEDLISSVPLGRTLLADDNPIKTRGPMQVHVVFAQRFATTRPYPYPVKRSIADEIFTRRGGLYFGIAHLLGYTADYDRYLYRFADFNAGQYASRNAAFQAAVASASGLPLITDGALLAPEAALDSPGETEAALRSLGVRFGFNEASIHSALAKSKSEDFEKTALYRRVYALAEERERHSLPRALVPQIELRGPKISRKLTTAWYANRVNGRFENCMHR